MLTCRLKIISVKPASAAPCSGPTPPSATEIRDNLTARISEAEREGWLGEIEGLKISLAGADDKLAQIERRTRSQPVNLGIPTIPPPRSASPITT
jgi:hypothetical protein